MDIGTGIQTATIAVDGKVAWTALVEVDQKVLDWGVHEVVR